MSCWLQDNWESSTGRIPDLREISNNWRELSPRPLALGTLLRITHLGTAHSLVPSPALGPELLEALRWLLPTSPEPSRALTGKADSAEDSRPSKPLPLFSEDIYTGPREKCKRQLPCTCQAGTDAKAWQHLLLAEPREPERSPVSAGNARWGAP